MKPLPLALILMGCSLAAPPQAPEPFGITMVEETACVGAGGRIVMGPEGAFCAMDPT